MPRSGEPFLPELPPARPPRGRALCQGRLGSTSPLGLRQQLPLVLAVAEGSLALLVAQGRCPQRRSPLRTVHLGLGGKGRLVPYHCAVF